MKIWIIPIIIGCILDFILGDRPTPYHMIRILGQLIMKLETLLFRLFKISNDHNQYREFLAGFCLTIMTILIFNAPIALILYFAYQLNIYLYYIIASFICYQMIALKDLKEESYLVYQDLENKDLLKARQSLSMIVGRDTECLDEEAIIKANIETIAENSSDGVIAPLFYMFCLGPIGGCLYKSINTLDSMVGYMNEKYLYFGRVSARLDDIANFLPSRISSFLMWICGGFLGYSLKSSWKIWWRDKTKHHSPNAGYTEAMMAGILSIQLAGDAIYNGVIKQKPYIGDPIRSVELNDIRRAHQLLYGMSYLGIIIGVLFHVLLYLSGGSYFG